jgi:hypothetical protein
VRKTPSAQKAENAVTVETEAAEVNEPISNQLTFDSFKSMYNENADRFSIAHIDEWIVKEGEKADVASFSYENRAFSVMLSRSNPAYVQGMFYIFPPSNNQIEMFQSLLRMYALILTFDPMVNQEIVPTFSMELLNNIGNDMVSSSGVEYKLQDVGGNFVLSITLPKLE